MMVEKASAMAQTTLGSVDERSSPSTSAYHARVFGGELLSIKICSRTPRRLNDEQQSKKLVLPTKEMKKDMKMTTLKLQEEDRFHLQGEGEGRKGINLKSICSRIRKERRWGCSHSCTLPSFPFKNQKKVDGDLVKE